MTMNSDKLTCHDLVQLQQPILITSTMPFQ